MHQCHSIVFWKPSEAWLLRNACSFINFGRYFFNDGRIFGSDLIVFLSQNRKGNSFFFEIQLKNDKLGILTHDSWAFHAAFCLAYLVYSTFELVCMSTKGNGVRQDSQDRKHFHSNKTHKTHTNKKTQYYLIYFYTNVHSFFQKKFELKPIGG